MPAEVALVGGKYRVVEQKDGMQVVVKNRAGSAVDGGGHATKQAAERQAAAVNASKDESND